MKVSIKLYTHKESTADGFPLVVIARHKNKQPERMIGRAWLEDFSAEAEMVLDGHPDYDVLAPLLMDIKLRARKMVLQGATDPHAVLEVLFSKSNDTVTLGGFYAEWAALQNTLIENHIRKKETALANKLGGNLRSVKNAWTQFEAWLGRDLAVQSLTAEILTRYRRHHEIIGNSHHTIHLYLRTLRALYNKAVAEYKLTDNKPFAGVFNGLRIQGYQSRKKHLDIEGVRLLEGLRLGVMHGRARDFFLLQFYFGGCDLIDLYFLKKNQLRKGRVRFERGKTSTGVIIDLKVHPRAQEIINRHAVADGEYLFGGKKDKTAYENWRGKISGYLRALQTAQNGIEGAEKIEVLPDGGNLAIKVARHTFANIGRQRGVDDDVLRALQGHVRGGVDTFYKGQFNDDIRDTALFEIIG